KDYLPQFDELTLITTSGKLNSMIQKDLYITKINDLRSKIILASASNQFATIDVKSWNNAGDSKIENISKSINLLLTEMYKTLNADISDIEKEFMIIAVIFFILLIQLIVLYIRFKSSKEDEAGFNEAIEAIKHSLKDKQIEELNKIIKKQDKIKLYNFMADVIEESSRAKDLFFASMSHEIRTPLNGILGFTNLLQSTKLTSEQKEFVKTINRSSDNLVNILNDILDFSKIKENKVELESIEFDPFDVFESAIELYAAKADEKDISLQLLIDTNINTTLQGDPTKLAQIIVNLISNAIKFTPQEGTVEVKVEKISSKDGVSTIKFSVKDTGIGVSEDQKQNIFKAFSQENVSTTRNFGGTGLGLSISSQFVEAMGGNLDIESVKGKGATFFFVAKFTELNPIIVEKNSFNIAFCMPHNKEHKSERKAIAKYITLTGAKYFEYDSIVNLIESDNLHTLDILFVDSTNEGKLKKISKSNVKIIYVTTLNHVNKNEKKHILHADEVIYKPLYFNKIQRSIAACMYNNTPDSKSKTSLSMGFDNLHVLIAEDNLINQKLLTH
ncbi:MAG: ATP-binding protein, partial [Candidatus Thermoplasmatota archaeon]|nr:ATP-binding protein [Candidatus Thermoplasmatota archaeon]